MIDDGHSIVSDSNVTNFEHFTAIPTKPVKVLIVSALFPLFQDSSFLIACASAVFRTHVWQAAVPGQHPVVGEFGLKPARGDHQPLLQGQGDFLGVFCQCVRMQDQLVDRLRGPVTENRCKRRAGVAAQRGLSGNRRQPHDAFPLLASSSHIFLFSFTVSSFLLFVLSPLFASFDLL